MKNLQSKLSIINSLIINKYYEKAKYICIDLIEKEPNFLPYRLGLKCVNSLMKKLPAEILKNF